MHYETGTGLLVRRAAVLLVELNLDVGYPAAMAVVFATLPIVASLGFAVAHMRPLYKSSLIVVSLALVPVAHFLIPTVALITSA